MARLTYVYRAEDINYVPISRRQLPIAGENLMMLMDLNHKGLAIDCPQIRGKELEEFTRKYNLFTSEELHQSLEIDSATLLSVLNQCVQCVGCRRRVERLFYQLTLSGHPTLYPLVLKSSCKLTITEEKMKTPQALGTLLYHHHDVLNNLLESKWRNKTRCVLHSLDAFRSKPFSETWREVWSSMKNNCRDELAVIETKELHEVLENYLKKHKFCQGCRTKIEKAYKILVGETTTKEKGFVAALYSNIKKCQPDKHIHVITNKIDFLDALIRRAEPEVNGSYSKLRERHAKTLEIAQEEVLTCVGMIMYERLRRIYVSLREEERACQVLAAVGVHALCRNFDTAVEKKQGISNLELLYKEISRAEKAKEHKREMRKLKKKKKKNEKKNNHHLCENSDANSELIGPVDDEPDEAVDVGDDEVDYVEDDEASLSEVSEVDEDDVINMRHEEHVLSPLVINFPNTGIILEEDDDGDEEFVLVQRHNTHSQKTKNQKQKVKIKSPSPSMQHRKQQHKKIEHQLQSNNSPILKEHNRNIGSDNNIITEAAITLPLPGKCDDCLTSNNNCPCENDVRDSGYGSEPNSHGNSRTSSVVSSPDGSEVCCSDGFCNHDQAIGISEDEQQHCDNDSCDSPICYQLRMNTPSLLQMLDEIKGEVEGENEDNFYIPLEVVMEYEYQREKVQQQRQELRETLRKNFERLCTQGTLAENTVNQHC